MLLSLFSIRGVCVPSPVLGLALVLCLIGCNDPDEQVVAEKLRDALDRIDDLESENQRLRNRLAEQMHESTSTNTRIHDPLSEGGAVAYLMVMLIQEFDLHPEKDVVEWYAKAMEWPEIPDRIARAGNAKKAYSGPVSGHRLVLAGGHRKGVFTVAIGEGFERNEFLETLRDYVVITVVGDGQYFGHRSEVLRVTTDGRTIGYVILNSAGQDSVQGAGTASFVPPKVAAQILGE